jgi:hypothetical protein
MCPADVPQAQWTQAVEWTANVISQDFSAYNAQEIQGLKTLSRELDERATKEVDLRTLQWIWDECANTCGGSDSYGIRFRNVKLLTKEPITDATLPAVWSLGRCTDLDLSNMQISDISIPYLSTLTQLQRFDIRGTQISGEGAEKLRRSLAKCQVLH